MNADLLPSGGRCRHCRAALSLELADLGACPVANDYVDPAKAGGMEPFYPLKVYVCTACRLAQTMDLLQHDALFRNDYAYFSSHSSSCSSTSSTPWASTTSARP